MLFPLIIGLLLAAGALHAQDAGVSFDVHPYLVYYHGGTSGESVPIPLVDRAGNVILCGMTNSQDFPLLPPGGSWPVNKSSVFVAKRDREGGTLLYSRRFGLQLQLVDAAIGPQDEVMLLVNVAYNAKMDSLLTSDAADSTRSDYGILILDCQGEITYCSYLPMKGLGMIDFDVDANGAIWVLANTYNAAPPISTDAPFPDKPGGYDGFLMRFSAAEHRLEYATYIGGSGTDYFSDLAVNESGVAVLGYTRDSKDYPVVNAFQDTLSGNTDLIITKLSADGRTVLFSTYLGGSRNESVTTSNNFSDRLKLDSTGVLYFACVTGSTDFPLLDSLHMAPGQGYDWLIGTITPQGVLRSAALLGSTYEFRIDDMEIDGCGHVVFTGWAQGKNITLIEPVMTVGGCYLSVLDTRAGELRFTSRIKGPVSDQGKLCLDGGTIFLTGVADSSGMPATDGFPGPHPVKYNADPFVAAFAMPSLCPRPAIGDSSMRTLALDLMGPDTLLIDILRMLVKPAHFPLALRLSNNSNTAPSGDLRLRLRVEGGIALDTATIPSDLLLPQLPPRGESTRDWTVHTNFDRIHPRDDVYVIASLRSEDPCPTGASVVKRIKVVYTDFTYADLRCEVEPMWNFERNAQGSKLEPDTVAMRVRVINRSDNEAPLQALRLHFSTNSGVQPFRPTEMERPIAPIAPRDTTEIFWTLRADTRQYNRRVSVEVALVDTFGYEMRHGVAELFIPGAPGTSCFLQAPSSLVLHGDGVTAYDTLLARLFVENESDTVRFYSALTLDLSAAPHLRVVEADTLERGAFYVRERFRRVFDWRLVATADVTAPTDEVLRAVYVTDSDGRLHECTRSVRLLPQRLQLDCVLISPDTLHPDATPALFDTVRITAVFTNSGDLRQELAAALLLLPDGVTSIEPLRLPLNSLEPGESDSVTWRLVLPLLVRPEVYAYTVLALRPDDGEAARCTRDLRVEAAPGRYSADCVTAGHDSVWRDPYYGRLIPNPLQLQYTLGNSGALDLPACEVAIVLPSPLRLAAGEDSIRLVPVLRPGERWAGEWLLDIDETPGVQGPWTVRWEVRCGDSLLDLSCVHEIGLAEQAPAGIVLTPWLLRFEGEREDPAPLPREVQIWTGGGTEPPWQLAARPTWMDAAPATGRGHVRLAVAPNTTMLVPGDHSDSVVIAPAPLQPGTIHIRYVLGGVLGTEERAMPVTLEIGAVHPNPVPMGAMLHAKIAAPSAQEVMVTVHDLLGRERRRLFVATAASGVALLRLPTSGLEAGMYLLTVTRGSQRRTRIFAIGR